MLRLGGSLAVTSAHLKLVEQGTQRKRGRLAVDEVPEVCLLYTSDAADE